jgi:LPS export ABC transporter protein LptC
MRYLASPWMIVALAAACGGSPQEPAVTGDFVPLPSDVMTDVVFKPTTNGVQTALLRSDTVYMRRDSARYDLVGVDLQMFDTSGKLSATLTSETGEYSTVGQAMVARGDVVLITVEGGRRIETEELHYDPNTRRVWSDVATTVTEQGTVMRGHAFSADDGFRNVNVPGYRGPIPGVRFRF